MNSLPVLFAQVDATATEESAYSWYASIAEQAVGPFTLGQLFLSFGIILGALVLRGILTRIVFAQLKVIAARTKMEYDDRFLHALEKPASMLILILGIFFAFRVLPLESEWNDLASLAFRGISMVIVFWGLLRLVDVLVDAATAAMGGTEGQRALFGFAPLIKKAARLFLSVVAVVMVVDNLGYDIGGILATLGVGGLAFAIAAKDTVANLYGSIALILDRPFKVGDWIQVGSDVDGDVEEIGLRSTKVRTWPKTVISIPNAVLANEKINNWSRMPKRRVKQVIGVTYETSPEMMNEIVEDFRRVLKEDEGVNQDFILVNWTDFGASSLDILVYYFTTTTKWLEYMDIRQRINTKLAQSVAAHGSSVAFPTRTLYLEGENARKLAGGVDLPNDLGPQQPS
jgi:MscS family membrane protein|tara:strand:+ start:1830 stop:3029 length:1200 start_codon:yes stop_codon:yes gene_type:complete